MQICWRLPISNAAFRASSHSSGCVVRVSVASKGSFGVMDVGRAVVMVYFDRVVQRIASAAGAVLIDALLVSCYWVCNILHRVTRNAWTRQAWSDAAILYLVSCPPAYAAVGVSYCCLFRLDMGAE